MNLGGCLGVYQKTSNRKHFCIMKWNGNAICIKSISPSAPEVSCNNDSFRDRHWRNFVIMTFRFPVPVCNSQDTEHINGTATWLSKTPLTHKITYALLWCHNGHDGVSNHQPQHCLLNRLFRRRSKKKSNLRVTGLFAGNSPETGEFTAQRASNAENVSIWWRHHELGHG